MAKSPYQIEVNGSFKEAAQLAIRHQLSEMLDNLPGTRAGDDPEPLHDMRVASRRLRAAMSVFEGAFPGRLFRPLEKEVARVTDALGAVRDADVQIEFMLKQRDTAPDSARVGLDAFIEHLQRGRDADRVALVKALNKLEKSRFERDFAALLSAVSEESKHHG